MFRFFTVIVTFRPQGMPHNHIKNFLFPWIMLDTIKILLFLPFQKKPSLCLHALCYIHHFAHSHRRRSTFPPSPRVESFPILFCNALESTQLHYYLTVQVHDLINPAVSKCLSGLPASSESLEPSADRASPKQPILVFHIVTQSGLEHLRSEWLGTSYASTPRMSSI